MAVCERLDFFQRDFITPAGERRKFLAEPEVLDRDGQPPGRRATPEQLLRHRQQRARLRCMCYELRAVGGFELAHLNLGGSIHGGIHENDGACLRNCFRKFGCELMAHESDHARQSQFRDRGGYLCSHAVIAAQRVAVTDDQKIGIGGYA